MKRSNKNPIRLGIDIGRVLMTPVLGAKADTSFLRGSIERAMATPPSPGAIEAVAELVKLLEGNVWLISKAGKNVQQKTRQWLRHQRFYESTGLARSNVRFCLQRHEKAQHCRQLKITHFVDDRLDVLGFVRPCVPYLYLFGEQAPDCEIPAWLKHVIDWNEALAVLTEDIGCSALQARI